MMKKRMLSRLKYELEDMKKYPQFGLEIDPNSSNIWYVSLMAQKKHFMQMKNLN